MIWKCDSDDPPKSKRDRSDISICTPVVCKVETPFIQLPRCENSAYREIMFQLDLLANGVELQFVAKINGKVSGELVLPYDD
jgi:cobalamin biosynthesis Co2+ chelatase CbiK